MAKTKTLPTAATPTRSSSSAKPVTHAPAIEQFYILAFYPKRWAGRPSIWPNDKGNNFAVVWKLTGTEDEARVLATALEDRFCKEEPNVETAWMAKSELQPAMQMQFDADLCELDRLLKSPVEYDHRVATSWLPACMTQAAADMGSGLCWLSTDPDSETVTRICLIHKDWSNPDCNAKDRPWNRAIVEETLLQECGWSVEKVQTADWFKIGMAFLTLRRKGAPQAATATITSQTFDYGKPILGEPAEDGTGRVKVSGVWRDVSPVCMGMLQILFEAKGAWVGGKNIGENAHHTRNRMPDAVKMIIETHKDNGYRIPSLLPQ